MLPHVEHDARRLAATTPRPTRTKRDLVMVPPKYRTAGVLSWSGILGLHSPLRSRSGSDLAVLVADSLTSLLGDRREKEESVGARRQRCEAEAGVEVLGHRVHRIHDDGVNAQGFSGGEDSVDGVREKNIPNPLPTTPEVMGQPAYERRGNRAVSGKLVGQVLAEFVQLERECAQAIEANQAEFVVNGDEDLGLVALSILARPVPEPIVECGLAAAERTTVVLLLERFDVNRQADLPGNFGRVEPKGLGEAR